MNVATLRAALDRYDPDIEVIVYWGDHWSSDVTVSLLEGSPDDNEPPLIAIEG